MVNKRRVLGALIAAVGDDGLPVAAPASTPPPPSTSRQTASADGASRSIWPAVCPETIVIQTDWFPESEYGAVYGLLGDDYEVDVENKIVSGPLISGGEPTGVGIEIRAGGAAGSGDVETLVYTDDAITLAFGTTDGQILAWENTPLLSVVAPLEINPLIIMWDPETYPDVASIADLGEQEITINMFAGATFPQVLAAMGILSEDQIDPSYDGAVALHLRGRGDRPTGVRLHRAVPVRGGVRGLDAAGRVPVDP